MKRSVLMIGNFLSGQNGSRGVCEDLAERLESRGWQVISASRKKPKILRLNDMLYTAFRYRDQYSVAQIDLYSGAAFFWGEMVAWMLARLHRPFVLTLHGGALPNFGARWPKRVQRLLRSAKIVTAPSAYLRDQMAPYRQDIRIVPNPIDVGFYPYRQRGPARPGLVWLRAFHQIYNPCLAVNVLASLLPTFPEARLTMVGPDKGDGSFQQTQAEAERLQIAGRVEFRGQIPKANVAASLAQADIFLNTTNFDNTPVSVIEAMACGLCVVSTRVGGTPYLIESGTDGLLVEPGNVSAMTAAVSRFLRDQVLARKCSANARKKVEPWDWATVITTWEDLLCSAQN